MSSDTFDEQWRSASAAARERVAMRLNQADGAGQGPGQGPGGADLAVRQDRLGAIGHAAYVLHGRLLKDGVHAEAATGESGGDLTKNGFRTGSALTTVRETWSSQVRTLLAACAQISNHLDHSAAAHARDDADIEAAFTVSALDRYLT
ncbi:hypothetical protein [Streptomyces sp. NPDC090025]|uniref:hypothetical protein n=1 Tax=Streptomyces sp. NPDC090025 TaxID=3365922 RepID=UPI0038373CBA